MPALRNREFPPCPEDPGLCLFARSSSRLARFHCGGGYRNRPSRSCAPPCSRSSPSPPCRGVVARRWRRRPRAPSHPALEHLLRRPDRARRTPRGRRHHTHNRDAPRPRAPIPGRVLRSVSSSRVGSRAEVGDPHHARVADVELRAAERVRAAERALGDEPAARPPGVTLVVNRRIGRSTLRRRHEFRPLETR